MSVKLMPRKESKSVGVQKHVPTKSEVKDIDSHLNGMVKEVEKSSKIVRTASSVFDIDKEIVNNSILANSELILPGGETIEIENSPFVIP